MVRQGRATTEALQQIKRQLDQRRVRIELLEADLELYKELAEDQELDLADALESQAHIADENRWLRSRLKKMQDFEGAAAGLPAELATTYPEDFGQLLDRLPELEPLGVVFTGDSKTVRELEDYDTIGRIAGVAWDALLVLTDYVRARTQGAFNQGVKLYLANTPKGFRTLPSKKFAEKETAQTMKQWGDLREFPVPDLVDDTGFATMEAHFKLGRVGMVSPRLYYLDCSATTGAVYVGYIGAHLRNTQTN